MELKDLLACIGKEQAVEVQDLTGKKLGYFLDAKDVSPRFHNRDVAKIWIIDDGDWAFKFAIQVKD